MLATAMWFAMAVSVVAGESADDSAGASNNTAEREEHLKILAQNKIESESPALIAYLKSQIGSPELEAEIAAAISKLGDKQYAVRQAASAKLATWGPLAKKQLQAATKSEDLEVAFRAEQSLKQLDSAATVELRAAIIRGCCFLLSERKESAATPVLLQTIKWQEPGIVRDAASQALWSVIQPQQRELATADLKHKDPEIRAIAVLAVAAATPQAEDLREQLKPFLTSKEDCVRLAAARALADVMPLEVARVLVKLVGSEQPEVAAQADALLTLLTGQEQEFSAENPINKAWQEWADKEIATETTRSFAELGDKRFDLALGRRFLQESFVREQADVTAGYGRFKYESTVASKAEVVDGMLKLDGNHDEADQRLAIYAQDLTGREEWPAKMEIRTRLGGGSEGSAGYHVGLSIGKLKAIFHPAYSGGGFRMETTDEHDYLVNNTDMGFTPQGGKTYPMVLELDRGAVTKVTVTVEDPDSKQTFRREFEFENEIIGKYNRVGLERSGRTGGPGLFESLTIQLGK